jgi:hypothetical protein
MNSVDIHQAKNDAELETNEMRRKIRLIFDPWKKEKPILHLTSTGKVVSRERFECGKAK